MRHFLEKASKAFELVLYTAARKEYADAIVDRIDPGKRYFHARLYRQHCEQIGGKRESPEYYVKNMRVAMNRAIRDCIIVDNLVYSFAANLGHGVLIKPFLVMAADEELRFLAAALDRWKPGTDSRNFVEREFGQREFLSHLGLRQGHSLIN